MIKSYYLVIVLLFGIMVIGYSQGIDSLNGRWDQVYSSGGEYRAARQGLSLTLENGIYTSNSSPDEKGNYIIINNKVIFNPTHIFGGGKYTVFYDFFLPIETEFKWLSKDELILLCKDESQRVIVNKRFTPWEMQIIGNELVSGNKSWFRFSQQ